MQNKNFKRTLTKTNKQKKANKEKRSKGAKINELYYDDSPFNVAEADINLTKLRYGMITSCKCSHFTVDNSTILLKNSWEEIILMMLDNLITIYPESFMDKLVEFTVTSQYTTIDTVYGKYSFDKKYKVYKIFDKDLYLESTFESKEIFNTIVGLAKALEIRLDAISFHLINKEVVDSKLNFSEITSKEIIANNSNVLETLLKPGTHLVAISVLDNKAQVKRIDVALTIFCKMIYDFLDKDDDLMLLLGGNNSTGVCLTTDVGDRKSFKLPSSKLSIYSDLSENGIIAFITESQYKLQLDDNDIQYKFEVLDLSGPKHEWEVD